MTRRYLVAGIAIALAIVLAGGAAVYVLDGQPQFGLGRAPQPPSQTAAARASRAGEPRIILSATTGKLELPPGNTIAAGSAGGKEKTILLRTEVKQARFNPLNTAYVTVPQNLLKELSGQRVMVVIHARRTDRENLTPFALAYSAGAAGASGWLVFTPSSEFSAFRFAYRVPARLESALDGDRIAIWADIDGAARPLELRQLSVQAAN